jgi:hypothetical protein
MEAQLHALTPTKGRCGANFKTGLDALKKKKILALERNRISICLSNLQSTNYLEQTNKYAERNCEHIRNGRIAVCGIILEI